MKVGAEPSTSRKRLAPVSAEEAAQTGAGQDTEENNAEVKNLCLLFAQFLKEFPGQRQTIKQCITCLREMADQVDKIHKNCTITSLIGNVTSALSEVFRMGSQFLDSSSARGSLHTAIAGISFGVCGTAVDVGANIFESVYKMQKKEKTEDLLKEGTNSLRKLIGPSEMNFTSELPLSTWRIASDIIPTIFSVGTTMSAGKRLHTHIKALKCVKEKPELLDLAMKVAAGQGDKEEIKKVWSNFQGTLLAKTKSERMQDVAWSLCTILGNIKKIAEGVMELRDGAEDEMAARIREKANQLQKELQRLNKLYEWLKEQGITEYESCPPKPKFI
ncbi:apolipoprotein L3-like isoform X2 [Varanus komodoensis]|uniref:apolipoprotein L3-like isoform X2 n=1 Tax=Varanus komodoensis TaxID=61221 RepID=UPI001CF79750|nr:apolipoprotein L3-like isoform X2 [Varanus komodoensis]